MAEGGQHFKMSFLARVLFLAHDLMGSFVFLVFSFSV